MGTITPLTTWNVGALRARPVPGAKSSRLDDLFARRISLNMFAGIAADGADTAVDAGSFSGTDNRLPMQAAIDYCIENEIHVLEVPRGTYRIGDSLTLSYLDLSDATRLSIIGDDPSNTFFLLDEDYDFSIANNAGSRVVFDCKGAPSPFVRTTKDYVRISGISFRGRWTHYPGGAGSGSFIGADPNHIGPAVFRAEGFKQVIIDRCGFFDIRTQAIKCAHNDGFRVSDCYGERLARGFCRSVNTNNAIITGNTIKHTDDDVVDINITSEVSENPPISVVVAGNTFVDCESVISNAARGVCFMNNVMIRSKGAAMGLTRSGGASPLSGRVAHLGNVIIGNVIADNLARFDLASETFEDEDSDEDGLLDGTGTQGWISIAGNKPSATTTENNIAPSKFDPTAGRFILPWETDATQPSAGYMYGINEANYSTPPAYSFVVSKNIGMRTLPEVAAYSDWGFGSMFTRRGWRDPPVVTANWRPNFIQLVFDLEDAIIEGNIVANLSGAGVILDGGNSAYPDRAFKNIAIRGNVFRSVDNGVRLVPAADTTCHWPMRIEGNIFDIDPYHISARRTSQSGDHPDGTWQETAVALRTSAAIWIPRVHGVVVHDNEFSNCYRPIGNADQSLSEGADIFNNLLRCDPADTGYDAGNKGIGECPVASDAYRYMIVESDPEVADSGVAFGDLLNTCPLTADAVPSAGKFVSGHRVKIHPPINQGSSLLHEAIRLTTGEGHVAGTDWFYVYANSDAPAVLQGLILRETALIVQAVSSADAPRRSYTFILDDFVVSLMDEGLWEACDVLWWLAAPSQALGLINWKDPGTFSLTLHGGATITPLVGAAGDGVAKYINTHWTPSTAGLQYATDDAHVACDLPLSDTQVATTNILGVTDTAGPDKEIFLRPRNGVGNLLMAINATQDAADLVANANTQGHYVLSRDNSADFDVFKNGAAVSGSPFTGASTGLPTLPMFLLARNLDGAANGFAARTISMVSAGRALTAGEVAAFSTAVAAFKTAIAGL